MKEKTVTIIHGKIKITTAVKDDTIDKIDLSLNEDGKNDTIINNNDKNIKIIKYIQNLLSGDFNIQKVHKKDYDLLRDLPINRNKLTPFQKKVFSELLKVPYGSIVSYEELALRSGGYNYRRAVAMALSRNPFPILIPCHRVVYKRFFTGTVNKSGLIGGFGCGTGIKKILLLLENPAIF